MFFKEFVMKKKYNPAHFRPKFDGSPWTQKEMREDCAKDKAITAEFAYDMHAFRLSLALNVKKDLHDEFMLLITNMLKQKPFVLFTDEERESILTKYSNLE